MANENSAEKAMLLTLVIPNPSEKESMGIYGKESGKLTAQSGAQLLGRFNVVEQLHGDFPATVVGIAEFPSAKAIKDMFDSEAYQQLVPTRNKAVNALALYISRPDQTFNSSIDSEKAFLVTLALPNPNEQEALDEYRTGTRPIASKYGAKPLGIIGIAENFHGDMPAAFLGVTEFPDADAIKGFFNDEAYRKLAPSRDKGMSSLNLYLAR